MNKAFTEDPVSKIKPFKTYHKKKGESQITKQSQTASSIIDIHTVHQEKVKRIVVKSSVVRQ